ncbi:hypothetical protein SCHPADRAFT_808206, partial [Schizopora paradoxa]
LSAEQERILDLVKDGRNVFFTGCAGTGKSFLLRKIIEHLRAENTSDPDVVAVTASTGIAACNIGGVTLHSFAGVGIGTDPADVLIGRIKRNKKAVQRWVKTKVLIIDEISMVDGKFFDKLSLIAKTFKNSSEAFGGLQIVITGDFLQLPPVSSNAESSNFAFDAEFWNETIQHTFNLTEVFRQSEDEFIDILAEMRLGQLSPDSVNKLKSLSRAICYDDGIEATELYSHRADVDRANNMRMMKLTTESRSFEATDSGSISDSRQRERMLSHFLAPRTLIVKIDAQVMLIKNIDEHLVNGLVGHVVGFTGRSQKKEESVSVSATRHSMTYPIVRFNSNGRLHETIIPPENFKVELPNGEVLVPLVLAWAMSIHKAQGLTIDRVKVDLGKVFEKGQAYVALSRATSMDRLQILNFNPTKVTAHPKV